MFTITIVSPSLLFKNLNAYRVIVNAIRSMGQLDIVM